MVTWQGWTLCCIYVTSWVCIICFYGIISWIQIGLRLWSLPSFSCSWNASYCDGGALCSSKFCGGSQHSLIKLSSWNWILGQPLNSTIGNGDWLKCILWFPLCKERVFWSFCSCKWTNQNLVSWTNLNGSWSIVKICLLQYLL